MPLIAVSLILIFPTCLSGALLYMTSLGTNSGNPVFPWAGSAAAISSCATAAVLFGAMVTAAHYLEQTIDKRLDEGTARQQF